MQQTSINRPTLKADPLYGLRYIGVSLVALGLVTAVWAIFRRSDISVFIALFMMALFGVMLFWYLLPWVSIEKRRQAAARQENALVPLAAEQPVPDETALSLPCKIKLRPKWKIPIICFCVLTPLLGGLLFLYVDTVPTNPPEPDWAPLATIGFSVLLSALIAALPLCLGWHSIKVTEGGLKVQECGIHSFGCNMSIQWDEVLLFAIYPARKRIDLPVCYELASPTAVIRWRRIRPGIQYRLATIPVPFDEYDRQMDALLSVIAAKTGLPLYDLR